MMSVSYNSRKKIVDDIFNKYNINDDDRNDIIKVIKPIVRHPEFIRRLTHEFLHHDKTTLGYHILEDTIVTFNLCKKKKLTKEQTVIAMKIAMLHDLYVSPWQNNPKAKDNKFFNKHGFRHPIEAVVNAITWFPEFFKDDNEAMIIIDGIIHHMFPFPVMSVDCSNYRDLELNNLDSFLKLDDKYKKLIYKSCSRKKIKRLSFAPSSYIEGKLMRKADKISSLDNFTSLRGIIALVTGINSHIER